MCGCERCGGTAASRRSGGGGWSNTAHPPSVARPTLFPSPPQGATDYEPRVVNQLLDFLYRYVSETLADADVSEKKKEGGRRLVLATLHTRLSPHPPPSLPSHQTFAEAAGHGATGPTPDDIALAASSARDARALSGAPPHALLSALASRRNAQPLPPLVRRGGLHPPPDADALLGQGYSVPPAPRAPPPPPPADPPLARGGRRPSRRGAPVAGNKLGDE